MNNSKTQVWAQALVHAIEHANIAHSEHGKLPDDSVRFHDRVTPYVVHPIWCAASLLQEPAVSAHLRQVGSLALLWHDTLEDTTLPLPPGTTEEVIRLVEGMTFDSFDQERDELWSRSKEIKLLKLYDKVSNLLDGAWMKSDKWNVYVEHTKRLAVDVELAFGLLGIVKIARAIAVAR